MIAPTPDQEVALRRLVDWYRENPGATNGPGGTAYITLGGYAGTGKTTLLAELAQRLRESGVRTHFCAFTAKAASVLRGKLATAGVEVESLRPDDSVTKHVTTIHSLIKAHREVRTCVRSGTVLFDSSWPASRVELESCGRCAGPCLKRTSEMNWTPRPRHALAGIDLIIVDEASMIGRELWNDLRAYGIKIIAVGDHGQLPPVGTDTFNLMDEHTLDLRLEVIHRQAETSPILHVATLARTRGVLPYGVWSTTPGAYVGKHAYDDAHAPRVNWTGEIDDLMVLCGRNSTRVAWNSIIRHERGVTGLVAVGDKVTCLKNTQTTFNGLVGTVVHVGVPVSGGVDVTVRPHNDTSDELITVRANVAQFGRETKIPYDELRQLNQTGLQLWDFGYAITVHKAQGSSAGRVIVMEERLPGGLDKHKRWLYTAVTRAERSLLILS